MNFFVTYGYGDDLMMCCPQCRDTNIHPISVSVLRGTDETTVNSEGITVKEAKNTSRGVRIDLEYMCEGGHHGFIIFQFCKGETKINHCALDPVKTLVDLETIWRS